MTEVDHRKIGKQLDLFSINEDAGPGLPLFHPKGTIILNILRDFWEEEHKKAGYVFVNTPNIYKSNTWQISGHWDYFKENMFITKKEDEEYAIKPMNCPGHMFIYKSSKKSYRDLPIRMGEMGTVYRNELSGNLTGLFRVVKITQDDAHIFCTENQVESEIIRIIDLTLSMYKVFGFKDVKIELSTKPEKAVGSNEIWEMAEGILKKVLEEKKMKYELNEGDGAFYGPKIDFHIKDSTGKTWQCGTIQLDFNLPERFNLKYAGEDNTEHQPIMIHRVIYGALERFFGILIEHYNGDFPTWLAPVQVRILSFTDRNIEYSKKISEGLKKFGIRVDEDYESNTMSSKVMDAELQKIPYIITCGDKEEEKETLAIRGRNGKVKFNVKPEDFIEQILEEIKEKK
ncbi:MAG: threonine--tRNA ligase [Nanoarchaeota archaeon]|nr:threonine--tRNA ligase [Nanoarchaeota archaeon]